MKISFPSAISVSLCCMLILLGGCEKKMYDSQLATRSYPLTLHSTDTIDVQVFRDDQTIELVNATARSYRDFDLWINQRYMRHVDELIAGQTLIISLWDFYDERGDRFNAGGFWRTREPHRVRLVEIQPRANLPLVGLVTIRAEDVN
ncbi:MAG: hypothetical protein O7G85_02645 [Planctomycetota bacterium]|nr:hypothetical protein [Planctomycetota bacterium]